MRKLCNVLQQVSRKDVHRAGAADTLDVHAEDPSKLAPARPIAPVSQLERLVSPLFLPSCGELLSCGELFRAQHWWH